MSHTAVGVSVLLAPGTRSRSRSAGIGTTLGSYHSALVLGLCFSLGACVGVVSC
jgi:hypothetical protein